MTIILKNAKHPHNLILYYLSQCETFPSRAGERPLNLGEKISSELQPSCSAPRKLCAVCNFDVIEGKRVEDARAGVDEILP